MAHLLWKTGNQRPHGWAHGSFRGRPVTGSSTCWSVCPRAWCRTRPCGQTPSAPTGVSGGPRVGREWTSREPGQADSSCHSENSPQTRAGHWINNFPHPRPLPPSLPRGPGHVTWEGGGLAGVWPAGAGVTGFPGGSGVKNLPANAGDMGSIPGSGRSPDWRAAVQGISKSQTGLSDQVRTHTRQGTCVVIRCYLGFAGFEVLETSLGPGCASVGNSSHHHIPLCPRSALCLWSSASSSANGLM